MNIACCLNCFLDSIELGLPEALPMFAKTTQGNLWRLIAVYLPIATMSTFMLCLSKYGGSTFQGKSKQTETFCCLDFVINLYNFDEKMIGAPISALQPRQKP